MRVKALAAVLTACAISAIPAAAWAGASTPLTPEEQAHDQEIIRNLNLRQLAYVRQRDAAQARQQEAGRNARADYQDAYDDYVQQRADYLRRRNAYEGSMDRFAEERRSYEERLSDWRRAVADCEAGQTEACGH